MALLRSGTRIYGNAKIDTVLDIDGQDAATSNITGALKVAGGIGVKGNVFSTGNITALNANLGNLVIANYYQGTLTTNAQPNITSVGSLTSLTVTGNFTGNNATLSGNLIVNGNLVYANVTTLNIKDPLIELGGVVDGTALTTNDLKDRGQLLHYYNSTPVDAFMGWDNSNGEFAFGSNVSVTDEIITYNEFGNIRANVFLGNLSGSATTVTASNQPNITSIGTLGNLNIIGNISAANVTGIIRTPTQSYITGLGTLTSLTVVGSVNLGTVGNIRISGGSDGYALKTDGTGNLSWGFTGTGNANISGSNTQIFFNDSGSNTLGTSANLTFDRTTNTVTTDYFKGDGSQLTNVSATTATTATTAGTVTTNAQPNITSIGNLTGLKVSNTTGIVDFTNTGNVSLGTVANLHIDGGSTGYVLQTDGSGNLSWGSATAAAGISIVSNIANIVAGSTIDVSVSYSNANFPGGVFTLAQLGPVTLSTTDIWSSGSNIKNAYANYISNTVNTENVEIAFSLANATFNVQSTDIITIGSCTITGANLLALNITGNSGTYTIPSAYLTAANIQTNISSTVSASLTTDRGVKTSIGTTLTNLQPVPFNITALNGTFVSSSVPYWSLDQPFNWSATVTSGATGITGNVTYSQVGNSSVTGSLTSLGDTTGTSVSLYSLASYTITSTDYNGTGQYGAGQRTIPNTVIGTVSAATKYYPLFWKITSNSAIPTFTTLDNHNSNNYTLGHGANTSTNPTDYLWLATPNNTNHTFKHVFLGSDIIDTPDASGDITISGQAYKAWGFTTFSQVANIVTTS